MTTTPTQPDPARHGLNQAAYIEELDPANRSLAEALRKSFRILKLLMLVLLVLYFLSGWFSVKQGEVGLVLRYGRIVGTGAGEEARDPVLTPKWYWSWPYPIERWVTVPTSEREMDVGFLFQLSEQEELGGIKGYKGSSLSPLRDDYLITGDVNIIHASLKVKYRIADAVSYVTNVYPMPDPDADARSEAFKRVPEHRILTNLIRDAVIETASRREALRIRGEGQDAFLYAIAVRLNEKLAALAAHGAPLGISVDPYTGVTAGTKYGVEGIMPPRQTQRVFDQVLSAQEKRSSEITKATSEARALLVRTAGPEHQQLAEAIEEEFTLMMGLSAAESAGASGDRAARIEALRRALAAQRDAVETILEEAATGTTRALLRDAEIARDRIIKDAAGDHEQLTLVRPEFLRNPAIFVSRLLDDAYAELLESRDVFKLLVPEEFQEVRLHIPRRGKASVGIDAEGEDSDDIGPYEPSTRFR